jgi:hypothetical protein
MSVLETFAPYAQLPRSSTRRNLKEIIKFIDGADKARRVSVFRCTNLGGESVRSLYREFAVLRPWLDCGPVEGYGPRGTRKVAR